jgi:hypothetical protein
MENMKHGRILIHPGRHDHILIGSDAHYWPGKPTTAHRAFVELAKELKPYAVIMNGDVIDAAAISRHPPIGWEKFPTVKEELEVAQERLVEIVDAAPHAHFIWNMGNHDARFETRLATVASEYKGIRGVHLKDHFPEWVPAWSTEIKHDGTIIKHRFSGGVNAIYNNTLKSGRTTITGHLHRLGSRAVSDYTGTRWGVEGGMLADRNGQQWAYTEDNPLDWQAGFVILRYNNRRLMWPQLVHVVGKDSVEWKGGVHYV